jgi:hypothetical protein
MEIVSGSDAPLSDAAAVASKIWYSLRWKEIILPVGNPSFVVLLVRIASISGLCGSTESNVVVVTVWANSWGAQLRKCRQARLNKSHTNRRAMRA